MASTPEYHKTYVQKQREKKKEGVYDLTELVHDINFSKNPINEDKFKKVFNKLAKTNVQKLILYNCLDLISLINADKRCLETEGAYIKNVTGTLKVNPAKKELRDNIKAFNAQLKVLGENFTNTEGVNVQKWLEE